MSIDLQNLNEQLRQLNPPQLRDRLIFEAVVVKGRGQCEVAAEHGVSQPRVSQIVAEVGAWLAQVLPQTLPKESTAGEMAVGMYLAEAQINFLLQRTMRLWDESHRDRVIHKTGIRGVVKWEETTTLGNQTVKAGVINTALRLTLAKARLAGVDTSGRTQRAMALAEEQRLREARQGEVRGQKVEVGKEDEGQAEAEQQKPRIKKPLIRKSGKRTIAAESVSAQVQPEQEDRAELRPLSEVKEVALNRLINLLRTEAACALWTGAQLCEYAEVVWEEQYGDGEPGSAEQKLKLFQRTLAAGGKTESVDPHPGPLPRGEWEMSSSLPKEEGVETTPHDPPEAVSHREGETMSLSAAKAKELRRQREKRRSPQDRRREFLAPLAAG